MAQAGDPTAELSAKLKRTYLELFDYSFFHGPSEIGNVDERFLGRSALANRLHTILANHETKSGAYLVTGYRGVGKSSFVAKVLSDLSSGYQRTNRGSRYLRIGAPLFLLAFLEPPASLRSWWAPILFAVTTALLFFYLYRTDPRRNDLGISRRSTPWYWRTLRTFAMIVGRSPNLRFRTTVQDLYYASLLELLVLLSFIVCPPLVLADRLTRHLYAFLLLVLVTFLATRYQQLSRTRQGPKRILRALLAECWHGVSTYINYSHRIYIKINLGQENLEEIEILRLIAANIHTKYLAFKKIGFANIIWIALRAALLFFVVGTIYYYAPIYKLNLGLKADSELYRYLPTQGSFMLQGETRTLDGILDRMSGKDRPPFTLERFSWEFEQWLKPTYRDQGLLPVERQGVASTIRRATIYVLAYTDIFIHSAYRILRDRLPLLSWFPGREVNTLANYHVAGVSRDFKIVPAQLDYLFIFYFFFAWYLFHVLSRWRVFGVVTHGRVLRKLRDLNDSINAQITRNSNSEGSFNLTKGLFAFAFNSGRSESYPIATLREIEKRLIEILDDVDRIPRLTVRPNFIFIFDELDKIEPYENATLSEKEAAEPSAARDSSHSSYEAARERQQRVLNLLSNLKHFFTTAKAKFIFIAGREMFDASLADVSDRHFFMGSIFNEVLYVPSFLRDPSLERRGDVTNMTEAYVCQLLLPRDKRGGEPSLRAYNSYLEDFFGEKELTGSAREIARRKRERIISDLSAFIVYLTYRSNGAPKKITRLLESYITTPSRDDLRDPASLCVGQCSASLYLQFDFYNLYTFGLVSYLASPLFLALNRTIRDFGDKLLVSMSFLLDHIYKFHGVGFSWRNLELMPEILDVNRAPELRGLIGGILNFLESSHIEEIVSGLYDFKFRKQITEEISFLSKVSEREAAAFNFTLDESLSLKRHYKRRLQELLSTHPSYAEVNKEGSYVHAVGFLRMILGDLHFYDEEYDQAIIEYMEAVQPFQSIEDKPLSIHRLVVVTRNMLKLGLAFEKKKSFDSAFITYGKITSMIIRFREIQLSDLGLEVENDRIIRSGDGAELGTAEQFSLVVRRDLPFDETMADLTFKMDALEGIRLIYQPLLAKLQVIEKSNLGGITLSDLKTIEDEFKFIVRLLDEKENFLITAEFKEKVGDILFYKNRSTFPAVEYYQAGLRHLLRNGLDAPITDGDDELMPIFKLIDDPVCFRRRAGTLKEVATMLSDTGDAVLGAPDTAKEIISREFLEKMLTILPSRILKGTRPGGRQSWRV